VRGDALDCFGNGLAAGRAIAQNVAEAAKYDRLSVDQGNAYGKNNFGFCLEDRSGIARNLEGAATFFKLSVDQGHPDGQFNSWEWNAANC
jgi:TPR repeat protein